MDSDGSIESMKPKLDRIIMYVSKLAKYKEGFVYEWILLKDYLL